MKFIKEWKIMYQYQTPTHKWQPATRMVILKYLTKPMSVREFSLKYKIKQPLVSQTMWNLYNEGLLSRKPCDCGKGFIYWVKKQ